MKRIIILLLCIPFLFFACKASVKEDGEDIASKDDISYAFGMAIGQTIKDTQVSIEYPSFLEGIKDVMEGKDTRISFEEANMQIQMALMETSSKIGEENLAKEQSFLYENGQREGVITTASGLQYEIITEGNGPKPVASDTVKVDYVGTLLDGSKFDSSIDRGEPAIFPLGNVIPGWTEGIQLMPVGSTYKLYIPSGLAYGEYGSSGGIAPNATLIFEVELLGIEPAASE